MFRRIDERTLVAGQIRPEDLAKAKAEGVTMIVNNRPDGEQAGQPSSAELEAAARAAGLGYRHIPVASGFSAEQVRAMAEALEEAEGRVLAFCLSGTRSTFLWALARAQQGEDGEELIGKAAAAGYDLRPIATHLIG
jgi:uncharacterized protein (TIGR01244 family)